MPAHEMIPANVTCAHCRQEFAATALFCPNCGTPRVRESAADPLVGKLLGERFLVVDRLGHGGSGTIYRAEHVTLRRRVAIKVLHHELSRDDLAIERFRREATTVAEIDNEHIVEIHDFGRTPDGRLYLAMELLDGETLDLVIARDGRLPIDRVADVLIQAGEALAEAHAIGYVHRDLRPRNLFLAMRRGRANFIKVLDFGLAKLVEKEGAAASTSLGMTFGDPRYMSPEQARGDRIDRRADIYQLGCVAYEMLSGQPPFVGGRVFDVLSRHVSEAPVPITVTRPDVPLWLEAAIARMLAKRPEDRFATTTRMVEALRQGLATGEVMAEALARRRESQPPESVSRIMQRMGIEPEPDPAAPLEEIDDGMAAAFAAKRIGTKSGTPPVGVPESAPPAAEAGTTQHGYARPPEPATPATTTQVGHAVDRAPAPAVAPPAPAPVAAPPVVVAPPSAPVAVAPAPVSAPSGPVSAPIPSPVASAPSEALGKRPTRPGESAGISQVWFTEGDRLDGGGALEENEARRLDRARAVISPSSTGLIGDDYEPGRPWGKIAAITAAALVALVAVAVALSGGGDDERSPQPPRQTLTQAPTAPDTTAAPAAVPEAPKPAPDTAAGPDTGAVPEAATEAAKPVPDTTATPEIATPPAVPEAKQAAVEQAKTAVPEAAKPDTAKPAPDTATAKATPPRPSRARPTKPERAPSRDLLHPPGSAASPGGGSSAPVDPYVDDENAKKAEFFARLADQALRGGDYVGAAGNYRKALEIDARNVDAVSGLGEIALQQGLYADAVAHLKKAARLAPRSSRVQTLLGEAYLNSGNVPAAAATFKKALQLDPDNARARDGYNEAAGRMPTPQDEP